MHTNKLVLISILFAFSSSCFYSNAYGEESPSGAKSSINLELSKQFNEEGIAAVKANDFDRAEALFDKSLKADSGNITAAFNLAGVLLNNKRIEEAISILKRYIKLYPKDAGLYVRLADCYFSQKQIDSAILNYEKALALDSKYQRLSSKLGTVYGLKGRMKDAEKMFRMAVQINSNDVQSIENLSVLLVANGKAGEAVPLIKTAIRYDNSPQLYDLLGQAYQMLGDKENAEIAFGRASSLKSNNVSGSK
jgi:tetratricopeptide (TPR) repeat protein